MWRANVALELALLLVLVGRRAHLRWPCLIAFLATLVARDAVCLYADWTGANLLYCWAYYAGSALAIAAQIALITEIGLKLVGPLKTLRGIVARNVPPMTAVFILGATFASFPGHPLSGIPHLAVAIYYCRRLDFAAAAGCSAGLIMLIGIALSLKIQFSHGVRPVAIGLLIETASSYVQAVFFMNGAVVQSIFPTVRCAAYLSTLVLFSAPARERQGRSPVPSALPFSQGVRPHV